MSLTESSSKSVRGVGGKRKKLKNGMKGTTKQVPKKKPVNDEDISSESDESVIGNSRVEDHSSDEEETVQEKRLKLARKYLAEIERQERERAATDEVDTSAIAHRLKEDVLEQAGRLHKKVADTISGADTSSLMVLRGHKLPITCLVISPNDKYIYSSSKDCSIIKWCLSTGKKLKVIPGGRKGTEDKHIGHTSHVLALAVSSDNKFLVSGCMNNIISVWNPDTLEHIHTFHGHRGPISGLVFRKGSHQLFSTSHDRSLKIWDLDEMAYIESLFGHQDVITAVDSMTRERAISSGGRDGSVRIWKVVEESQLVYQGHKGSIDCVKLIDEQHFISASDDGSLALWGALKKKPLALVECAHGMNKESDVANWITAIAVLPNTDLVASGSMDASIRIWKCENDCRGLTPLFSIPMVGFINALQFTSNGSHLVVGVGQEHRLGRWWRLKEAKNSIVIVPLKQKS